MALRKARAYTKKTVRPYTRKSKVRQKSYIKTVPNSKIVKFQMGDSKGFAKGKYPIVLEVKSKEKIQMRDNSIEALRQYLNRFLLQKIGKEFFFEVKIYPHHIIRENKMLTGAGADRMQTGMARSFGKTMGRSALVKQGQVIFRIGLLNTRHETIARKLIGSVKSRMPTKISIDRIETKVAAKKKKVVKKE